MTTGSLHARAWKRMAAAYLCLVGLPVAAVPLILSHGKRLQPPPSLAGEWRVHTAAALGGQPCAVLGIVQSGRVLELRLGDMAGSGRVDGANVTVRMTRPAAADAACQGPGGEVMILRVAVAPLVEPVAMAGNLSSPGCGSCPVIPFRAVRSRTTGASEQVPQ